MLAVEISKLLKPEKTILISSAQTKEQLPRLYRFIGRLKIIPLIPKFCFQPPAFIAIKLFSAKNKTLIKAILKDTNPQFSKWAAQAISTWDNTTTIPNTIHIHGNKDFIIPIPKDSKIHVIEGGGHFMIVENADEIIPFLQF